MRVAPATTLIHDLAVVLGTAAVTTVVCRRLGQPIVLGYLLAGLIVGPHVPIPLVANEDRIRLFSELGVILVMFSIGLDFSIRRIARVLPTAGIIGVIQISTMFWSGFLAARALGWAPLEATFAGAAVCISSTMIVAKVFAEQNVTGRRRELVFAILIVEDLAAVLLITVLTALGSGVDLPAGGLLALSGRLLAFLLGVTLIGFLVVPRAVRAVSRLKHPETLLVACVGLCFGLSLLAESAGFSVALGAFMAGSLVAESGEGQRVERLLTPMRDIFAALFFVAIGMSVDPMLMLAHWQAVGLFTLVVLVGQSLSVSFGSFLAGNDVQTSVRTGMSLAQIGEFSFIIAGIGVTTGSTQAPVLPVIVAVAVLTTFLTPWFVRWSDRTAAAVEHRMPHRLQTYATLYAGWWETLRRTGHNASRWAFARRLVRQIALDAILLAVAVIGTSAAMSPVLAMAESSFSLPPEVGRWLLVAAAAACSLPFVLGITRAASRLGSMIAHEALPVPEAGRADFADAPRRALVVSLQLAILLAVMVPLLALTQPFVPLLSGVPFLAAGFVLLGFSLWRRATNLQEHVQAGAQIIADALALPHHTPSHPALDEVQAMLPGLGTLSEIPVREHSIADGATLSQLDLRARTGATVVAILRGEEAITTPSGHEPLRAGDRLAVSGTQDALADAVILVRRPHALPAEPAPADAPPDAPTSTEL
ncbi:MAG: cation:proton antiporter domain-containing protein [Planctomycetota bacterium]